MEYLIGIIIGFVLSAVLCLMIGKMFLKMFFEVIEKSIDECDCDKFLVCDEGHPEKPFKCTKCGKRY